MTREHDRELLVAFGEWGSQRLGCCREHYNARIDAFLDTLPQPCGAGEGCYIAEDGEQHATYTCELSAGHDGPHVENWGGGRRKEWR